jgi:[citrate (pro-3S)-lyase] ligase
VANCNPFTNGHLYLIEQAASKCDLLYLFILSEQRSRFPSHDRMELAQASTKHLRNVVVSPTSAYLISSATFPDYFIKDKLRSSNINCKLDIIIFATKIALPLGINMRFVGTEPYCQVTKSYNEQMKSILPVHGIELVELPRCEISGRVVSASMVRELFDQGKMNEIQQFVPNATYKYLKKVWQ